MSSSPNSAVAPNVVAAGSDSAQEPKASLEDTVASNKPHTEVTAAKSTDVDSVPPQDRPGAISTAPSEDDEAAQTAGQTSDSAPTQAAGEGSESSEGGGSGGSGSGGIGMTASTSDSATGASSAPSSSSAADEVKQPKLKKSNSRAPPPPFVDDPNKITLRFIFANRDGLNVTVDCQPTDTVGEVKGLLLSMWPEELDECSGGGRLRLICMGKGILMPDTRTLKDCEVPVFKTHATPVNVAVTPEHVSAGSSKDKSSKKAGAAASAGDGRGARTTSTASTGCACIIL